MGGLVSIPTSTFLRVACFSGGAQYCGIVFIPTSILARVFLRFRDTGELFLTPQASSLTFALSGVAQY